MTQKSLLHLNLYLDGPGHHPAAWRLTPAASHPASLDVAVKAARLAERGKFDSILLADSLRMPGHPARGPSGMHAEPLTLLGAVAACTARIGLIAPVLTAHSQPYNIARRLATLDHVSRGRAGWLASLADPEAADNFDSGVVPGAAQEQEYHAILRSLWDSWQDDARQVDKAGGTYVDVTKVKAIDHTGPVYSVTGPLDIPRSPQGHPLAAAWHVPGRPAWLPDAELVFLRAGGLSQACAQADEIRGLARHAAPPRILPTVSLVCSPSPQQVQRRLAARAALNHEQEWSPAWPVLAGTPQELADIIEQWIDSGAADGLNIAPAVLETDLPDIVDYLIPELQQRGRFRQDYEGVTLRAHYGFARPVGRRSAVAEA
jgi:alkanesulfonate monooxygenase SsuD/methylene tetrahydromethanopterin reductase-like flavin-dependent oxidoreductase (luciferase family)